VTTTTRIIFSKKALAYLISGAIMFAYSLVVHADMFINTIHESSGLVVMIDKSRVKKVVLGTFLKGGAELSIINDSSYVELVGGDGKVVRVDNHNSPYTIPVTQHAGWMSNAVRKAVLWKKKPRTNRFLAITHKLNSRIDESKFLSGIHRMNSINNYISEGVLEKIHFSWKGGHPPFQISLEDLDGEIIFEKEVKKNNLDIDMAIFKGKVARFRVENTVKLRRSETMKMDVTRPLMVVDSNSFPKEVIELLQSVAPQNIKSRISIKMFSMYEQWDFFAHQLYIKHYGISKGVRNSEGDTSDILRLLMRDIKRAQALRDNDQD